jgi:Rrf2 family nitric oxide-sensitive transcriptional repressor
MEDDLNLVECFCDEGTCVIKSMCKLKSALNQALAAYLDTLKRYTLLDLLKPRSQLIEVLEMTV